MKFCPVRHGALDWARPWGPGLFLQPKGEKRKPSSGLGWKEGVFSNFSWNAPLAYPDAP